MNIQGQKFALGGYGPLMWVSIGWTILVAAALCTRCAWPISPTCQSGDDTSRSINSPTLAASAFLAARAGARQLPYRKLGGERATPCHVGPMSKGPGPPKLWPLDGGLGPRLTRGRGLPMSGGP